MPTISKESLEWLRDELERRDADIDSLTDDLIEQTERADRAETALKEFRARHPDCV